MRATSGFISFLRTGQLGPVFPGVSIAEMRRSFGAPTAKHTPGDLYWEYGDLQIFPGKNDAIELIGLYHWRNATPQLPRQVKRILGPIPRERRYAPFLRLLKRHSIRWRGIKLLTFDDQIGICLESGVEVVFGSGRIYGIFLNTKGAPYWARKKKARE